jgi:fructoselysine-6-P-deglycase FrlB-like protein
MPELTWTTALAWFGVLSGAASVASLVFGLIMGRQTKALQTDIHAAMQVTLSDINKSITQGQQATQAILERMDAGWREAFDRMDQRAEERYRDLRGRIEGEHS